MEFLNKTVIITGAGGGIGRATAKAFAGEGANVLACDIYLPGVEALAAEAAELGLAGRIMPIKCDVSCCEEIQAAVDAAIAEFGRIDIIVNNAGMDCNTQLSKLKLSEWDKIMSVNLTSAMNLCRLSEEQLKLNRGNIINVASVAGLYGAATGLPYPTSKAAMIGMSTSLAWELAPYGVRVNAIAPGVVNTRMVAELPDFAKKSISGTIPLGRFAEPENIADVIAFLASDRAAYITGVTLNVDGGYRSANAV